MRLPNNTFRITKKEEDEERKSVRNRRFENQKIIYISWTIISNNFRAIYLVYFAYFSVFKIILRFLEINVYLLSILLDWEICLFLSNELEFFYSSSVIKKCLSYPPHEYETRNLFVLSKSLNSIEIFPQIAEHLFTQGSFILMLSNGFLCQDLAL